MERILNIKVDLEHPDDAKFAIDKAVEVYEESRQSWTAQEIADAKHMALSIMSNLCWEGNSMIWTVTDGAASITTWKKLKEPSTGQCYMPKETLFNIWVEKCVALCIATGKEVPEFITDKAGECW